VSQSPGNPTAAADGVAAPRLRPCVRCAVLTDDIVFDGETGWPEPARCAGCRVDDLDTRYWLVEPTADDAVDGLGGTR
jgi:hypothetical protein